jgi:VanZ family protein
MRGPAARPLTEDALHRRPPERRGFELFVRYWLPALAYVTLVLVIGAQPGLRPPLTFENGDKVMHLLEYGPLGFLFARALRATLRVPIPIVASIMAVALGIMVGASDETIQRFTPGRQSSIYDVAADTVGLSLAQVIYLGATRKRGQEA